jgi:succinate dehydrogenase/fumarate reductase flavoprotein subunit
LLNQQEIIRFVLKLWLPLPIYHYWLIEDLNVPIYDRYPSDFPEHTVQRFFVVEGGSTGLTNTLADEFVKKGGTLLLETRATDFIMDGKSVAGAKALDKDGNEISIKAKKTILATGGFGNNLDMLTADISNAVFYGVASSTGDGHKMAEAIGAKMVFMEYAKMYPQGISMEGTNAGRADPTSCLTTTNNTGAIYVNKEGKRVVDENLDFVSIKKATIPQTDQMIFLVMDQTAFDMWSKLVNDYPSPAGRVTYEEQEKWFNSEGKPIFTRGTLKEAAELAGIDAGILAETVANWNKMVASGKDTEFGREELYELDTDSKFYIVEQRLRFATTLGGVDVNTKLEVKDNSDTIIPNLYAAGEVVGGANGIEAMPGCMLGWSVNSGRFAGYSAAEALLSK